MPRRPSARPQPHSFARTPCPIASSLDLLGDKWTLLVVRDALLFGKKRFGEFLASGEGISTNLLTERLERLEQAGVLERCLYQRKPARYEYIITPKGKDLLPVLAAMATWANEHIPGTHRSPPETTSSARTCRDRR